MLSFLPKHRIDYTADNVYTGLVSAYGVTKKASHSIVYDIYSQNVYIQAAGYYVVKCDDPAQDTYLPKAHTIPFAIRVCLSLLFIIAHCVFNNFMPCY